MNTITAAYTENLTDRRPDSYRDDIASLPLS